MLRPLKRLVKQGIATCAVKGGLVALRRGLSARRRSGPSIPILLYHRVVPRIDAADMLSLPQIAIEEDTFERQMAILSRDFRAIGLGDLVDDDAWRTADARTVVVTFDDGWLDNYRCAYPVLSRHCVPATIFLTTGYVGRHRMFWQERLTHLLRTLVAAGPGTVPTGDVTTLEGMAAVTGGRDPARAIRQAVIGATDMEDSQRERAIRSLDETLGHPRFPFSANAMMDWDQVREMAEGGITFGSHTVNHLVMTRATEAAIENELADSKAAMEAELGSPCTLFAYPRGAHDDAAVAATRDAGYRLAVTTERGLNTVSTDRLRLRRINVSQHRFAGVSGAFSPTRFVAALDGMD